MIAEAIRDVEEVIVRDVGLSYRLLKYINSAAFGIRSEIGSVRQALSLLGLRNIRRWLSVLSLALLGKNKPHELILTAMLRGRILEEMVNGLKQQGASECFLLGLFSLLDTFLDQPMEQVLQEVSLPRDVYEGLTNPESRFGNMLDVVKAIESGHWNDVDDFCKESGLSNEDLIVIYTDSLKWVDEYGNLLIDG
jgi:EAL and modified HD-GYP domain-containing signal transduction protein